MKILFLAPQPFFQERGTPIAVKLALEALSSRLPELTGRTPEIDLLAYDEGDEVSIPGVRVHRIPTPKFLKGIRPGISCKKLALDIIFLGVALRFLWSNRNNQYNVVHAVEESVFIAWLAKFLFKTPYVYDMDSSLALQLTEKWWLLTPLSLIFSGLERLVIRGASAVAPVCDALEALAQQHGAAHTVMLRDVSLLPNAATGNAHSEIEESHPYSLKKELSLDEATPIVIYVGNLESYQGIDLLLETFRLACSHPSAPVLVVVGGDTRSIEFYTQRSIELGCATQVVFLGPRPVSTLKQLLSCADIVVSPRVKGNNTPMKIYSYLHSGKALLATKLPTHTQVLDPTVCVLADANPKAFAEGMLLLLSDPGLREEIGQRAFHRAEKLYTISAFQSQLLALYSRLGSEVLRSKTPGAIAVNEGV
jgi:glycosyltransferase involved in cell wall biosynthesis